MTSRAGSTEAIPYVGLFSRAENDVLIAGCGPVGPGPVAQLANVPDVTTAVIDRRGGPLEVGPASRSRGLPGCAHAWIVAATPTTVSSSAVSRGPKSRVMPE